MPQEKQYDYLIVGAGLFGAVFACEMRKADKRCLVIDKRPHTGGNIYCAEVDGIQVHRYGAHIFHTDNEEAWQYVNRLVPFNRYTNAPLACYQGKLYNLPFNMNTFYQLWGTRTPAEAQAKIAEQRRKYAHIKTPRNLEEQALKMCGEDIYIRLIKGYTEKQWGRAATELPAFIIKRIPFRFTFDNNYFNDPYQGIPIGGYNRLIDALLRDIEVRTNINYITQRSELAGIARDTLYTGCIDEYFDFCYGRLEYRSLRFEEKRLTETDNFQGNAVVNYCERDIPYTRLIEHKHFEFGTQPGTVITYEYPDTFGAGKEPYYPVNDERNTQLCRQYKARAAQLPNLFFGGRLGQYAYTDMDDSVTAALRLARKIVQPPHSLAYDNQ
jgi:UDP-galactopyranose mutase